MQSRLGLFIPVLALSVVAARGVPAQGLPSWVPSSLVPGSAVWYYGCAVGLPGACAQAGIGRLIDGPWTLFYDPGVFFAPNGSYWSLFDIWFLRSADGSCTDSNDIFSWGDTHCIVQNRHNLTLSTQIEVDWGDPSTYQRLPIEFSVTPEPATLMLVATGLGGLLGLRQRRQRRLEKARAG